MNADDEVERAAMALYGELDVGPDPLVHERSHLEWDKERLRLAARRILAAARDPLWGKR